MSWIRMLLLCQPLLVLAADAAAPGWTLERLMETLAAVETIDATFTERKELAILREPLVSTGILRYRAPAYLQKQILQPQQENYEIRDDWLSIETSAEGRQDFYLRGYPLLRAFVEPVRAILAGDLRTLRRYYRVQLQEQAEDWLLRLEPVDKEIAKYVTAIVIRGRYDRLLSVETLETGGDRSLMTITSRQD